MIWTHKNIQETFSNYIWRTFMYFWRNWNELVYTFFDLFSEFILTGPFCEIEIVDHVCKMNRSLKMLTFCEIEYLRIGIHQKSPVTCSTTVQIGIISSFDLKCWFIVDLRYQKSYCSSMFETYDNKRNMLPYFICICFQFSKLTSLSNSNTSNNHIMDWM